MPKVTLPFYVYKEGESTPYSPSAFMGNYKALSVDLKSTDDVQSGTYALKIKYDAESNWYGLALVNPMNDWGDNAGGYGGGRADSAGRVLGDPQGLLERDARGH